MLRAFLGSCGRMCGSVSYLATSIRAPVLPHYLPNSALVDLKITNPFSTLTQSRCLRPLGLLPLFNRRLLDPTTNEVNPSRTLIKYSLQKGKRKTVRAVIKRFYRLDWGIWIRTKCGRHKHIYKKSWQRRKRLRQHVFTNATQSWLLDTMVTRYWRKRKYIPDDPYNPYHVREDFPITRKKPVIPEVAS